MKLKANAKINLTLDILGKRADGYHLIDSVFQSVSLYDTVQVEMAETITVGCSDNAICNQSNIAYKAAKKFFEYTGIDGGANIQIEKHIPLASGMGGGSADAAAVIVALDKIYKTNLSKEKLCDIGLSVGADVPFCIVGGTARVGGIGENMEKLSDLPHCVILLIKHGKKQSTADMYSRVDAHMQDKYYTDEMVKGIKNNSLNAVCKNVFNAFDSVCDNKILIDDIKKTNPEAVSLSGSGPTVFALFDSLEKANIAKLQLEEKGYNPIIATPSCNGIEIE